MSTLLWLLLIVGAALLLKAYLEDRQQTTHTLLRNYPILGRARYQLEHLGIYLRQYFFAMDREEMPFNRAQRSWVYRAAKNLDNTVAFGSTKNATVPGTVRFLNAPFARLDEDCQASPALRFGPFCRQPYEAQGFFHMSGMSYGALSDVAIRALGLGAAKAGCWINTGEGGLAPIHLESGADIVFQLGTAKYGVRTASGALDEDKLLTVAKHRQVKMFEIKLSQGAKPGKGGVLPGAKVTPAIARVRGIPEGQDSLSPNRHREITDVPSCLDFLARVREITGKPTGLKFVLGSEAWLTTLCEEIHRRGIESAPDFLTLDSGDGGTGAAPMALLDDVGLLLRDSLPLVDNTLRASGLRDRVRVIASGKLITPTDVAFALCLGADICVTARGFMFSLGCIQALQCNQNTCPTGITTHDPRLQRGLVPSDKAERVVHYHHNLVKEVEQLAHACGLPDARAFQRQHASVVQANGVPVNVSALYPLP
jgi:glutamate synthase domain-containing protein 2